MSESKIPEAAIEAGAREDCGKADPCQDSLDHARAVLTAALPHLHPVVTTAEEVSDLPGESIILNSIGNAWQRRGRNWYLVGSPGGQRSVPYLPATVLHRGGDAL